MVLTDNEKRELALEVLRLLREQSIGVNELPAADTMDGVGSLPAYQTKDGVVTAVVVPISLLGKPALDAAGVAQEVIEQARKAIADTEIATTAANNAVGSINASKQAADKATQTALDAAGSVEESKTAAIEAATSANKAAESAFRAADDADTITTLASEVAQRAETAAVSAETAGTLANNNAISAAAATKNANTATDECKKVTTEIIESGTLARTAAGKAEEQIVRMQELAASIGESGSLAPSIMELTYLKKITLGNPVVQKIVALLKPEFVVQNVLFLGDDKALSVDPAGQLTLNGPGKSRIYVIPTDNTRIYQTIEIEVQAPVMRLTTAGEIRLDERGNIRLT